MWNKRLFSSGVCLCFLACSGVAAQPSLAARRIEPWPLNRASCSSDTVVITENRRDDSAEHKTPGAEDQQGKQKQERSTQQQRPAPDGKTDPLTPFEPTERVPADQAVDFPYDI